MRTGLARYLLAAVVIAGAGTAVAQEDPGRGELAFNGQRIQGTVTATAADHLSLKTETGETYEVAITPNTRMMKERQPAKLTDVKTGDGVVAMGELDASKKTLHALFVAIVDAEQVKKLRENLGKTYITGKVTAIDDVKLTIMRPDNVSQVIEVDETTSFRKGGRRGAVIVQGGGAPGPGGGAGFGSGAGAGAGNGGESITLADVKVGDMVAGQGSVKNGMFVPTNLTVLPPGAMGPRGGRRGGEGVTTAPAAGQGAETPKQ
jgi:hypothetical protein